MSIEFLNVSKRLRRGDDSRLLFDDLNFRIEAGARIAVLGPPKSGKTTLLRLVCGTAFGDTGTINRTSSVSWPIPLKDVFVGYSSVATNIRFIMRLYGLDDEQTLREMANLVDISEFLNTRLGECPRHVSSRLAFALGVGLGFDVCLLDERVTFVDKDFKPRAIEIVKALSPQKAIVMATSLYKELGDIFETVFVLENGNLTPFPDAEEGIEHYKSLVEKAADSDSDVADAAPEVVEDEFVLEVGI